MPDAPLSLRRTGAGFVYVDAGLYASDWDNTALLDGTRGLIVTGTDDVDRAQLVADEAISRFFGPGVVARHHAAPARWRLFCTSEDPDELEYRPAEDAAEPAVLFTAEEVTRG